MKNAPFLAPTSVKAKQDGSLIYCPHRVQIVKEVTHGHTYKLQMGISGFLDNRGMTLDFGDLKAIFKEELEPYLDHRYLNESLPYMNTTAENMCYWNAEFRREWLVD